MRYREALLQWSPQGHNSVFPWQSYIIGQVPRNHKQIKHYRIFSLPGSGMLASLMVAEGIKPERTIRSF